MINGRYMELIKDEYKKSFMAYQQGKPTLAFSSHQPVLVHLLNTIKQGNVLEFGTGYNSTPLMHIICGLQGRHLTSLETDQEWFNKFTHYKSESHEMFCMEEKTIREWNDSIFDKKFSIAFIDGAPAELRQPFIEKIKDNVDYFVVHDTECVVESKVNVYAFDFSMFKYVFHFKTQPPMTAVLSNLEEIPEEIKQIFS